MRYRALTATGDYSFGGSQANFLVNTPQAVAQAVQTRLGLRLGEWFLNTADGTPWTQEMLGKYTDSSRDLALKGRILGTQGIVNGQLVNVVNQITSYSSSYTRGTRTWPVSATVLTVFSDTVVQTGSQQ